MDIKFGAGETPADTQTQTVTTAAPEQAVAPIQSAVPAKRNLVLGDILPSFDQVILPRVNISQNIGKLKDVFTPGTLVLAQQTVLFALPTFDPRTKAQITPPTPPVVMTALGFRPTRFVEKTTGGARGAVVNTEADVVRCGGTTDYGEWNLKKASGMKLFQPLVDACVLIERPEASADDDSVFVHEVDGKKYALALWALKGTLYTSLAKGVWFTHRMMGCLRKEGYPSWSYNISTIEKTFDNGNVSFVPVGTPHKKNTEAFISFVRDILEPPQQ